MEDKRKKLMRKLEELKHRYIESEADMATIVEMHPRCGVCYDCVDDICNGRTPDKLKARYYRLMEECCELDTQIHRVKTQLTGLAEQNPVEE